METDKDRYTRRCPRLGGPVTFRYCRTCEPDRHPCCKVFDCWWETFDIVSHMKARLSAARFQRLIDARPQPKIESLLDLIARAKENSR